jgi:hypothetical protein
MLSSGYFFLFVRIVELVRAAWRTPLRSDSGLGRFDTPLRPAKLGAFIGAGNEEVDDMVGEDGAEDLKPDLKRQVEEWAVLRDTTGLLFDWSRSTHLDNLAAIALPWPL